MTARDTPSHYAVMSHAKPRRSETIRFNLMSGTSSHFHESNFLSVQFEPTSVTNRVLGSRFGPNQSVTSMRHTVHAFAGRPDRLPAARSVPGGGMLLCCIAKQALQAQCFAMHPFGRRIGGFTACKPLLFTAAHRARTFTIKFAAAIIQL